MFGYSGASDPPGLTAFTRRGGNGRWEPGSGRPDKTRSSSLSLAMALQSRSILFASSSLSRRWCSLTNCARVRLSWSIALVTSCCDSFKAEGASFNRAFCSASRRNLFRRRDSCDLAAYSRAVSFVINGASIMPHHCTYLAKRKARRFEPTGNDGQPG